MQRVRPLRSLVGFCLSLSMSLVSCQAPPVAPISEPLSTPNVKLTKVTEGFDFSVKMTLLPDGSFLVTEKNTGFVRRVSPTFQLQPEPVIDIAVNHASERGLLGIAAHPEFSRNGYVYVASDFGRDTDNPKAASDSRVARFQLDRDGVAQAPLPGGEAARSLDNSRLPNTPAGVVRGLNRTQSGPELHDTKCGASDQRINPPAAVMAKPDAPHARPGD